VPSKAHNSQLNLPHCTVTDKIMTGNLKRNEKNLRSTGIRQEAVESVLWKESILEIIWKIHRF